MMCLCHKNSEETFFCALTDVKYEHECLGSLCEVVTWLQVCVELKFHANVLNITKF